MDIGFERQKWLISGFAALLAYIFTTVAENGILNVIWAAVFVAFWAGASLLMIEALKRYNNRKGEQE